MKELLIAIAIFVAITGCKRNTKQESYQKFEPNDGECLIFAGQDLGAIGGLENYSDGYLNHFEKPAGFTMYTNLRTGDESYGHTYRGLDGIWQTDNWGSGDSNIKMQLDDANFDNMVLAIGFELVNQEEKLVTHEKDNLLDSLANCLNNLSPRPIFLRIGYEFDGHEWNHYNREDYIEAFQYIRNYLEDKKVDNVAYVWQSKGSGSDVKELESWYPGDEYVDWCAYSFFSNPDQEMIKLARRHNKPVFIAEATPVFEVDSVIVECDFDNANQALQARDEWFKVLFKTIDDNADVIKAVSYINVNWREQAMWQNPPFSMCDSRIQQNDELKKYWTEETSKNKYLKPDTSLFKKLWR